MTLPKAPTGTTEPQAWLTARFLTEATGVIPEHLEGPLGEYEERERILDNLSGTTTHTPLTADDITAGLGDRIRERILNEQISDLVKRETTRLRGLSFRRLASAVDLDEIHDTLNAAWVNAHEVIADVGPYLEDVSADTFGRFTKKEQDRHARGTEAYRRLPILARAHEHYLNAVGRGVTRQTIGPAEQIVWSRYDVPTSVHKANEHLFRQVANKPGTLVSIAHSFATVGATASLVKHPIDAVHRRAVHLPERERILLQNRADSIN